MTIYKKCQTGFRSGARGSVPDEVVAGRMTQVPTILWINVEEESYILVL